MNRNFLLILFTIFLALPSFAQKEKGGHDSKRKEMLEIKMKFLSDEMGLNEEQSKLFYETYPQMERERRAVFKKIKEAEKSISDKKDASEADYDKASKEIADGRAQMMQIEQKYDEKFSTFLSKKQLFKMKEAEEKFQEKARLCRDKKKSEKERKR